MKGGKESIHMSAIWDERFSSFWFYDLIIKWLLQKEPVVLHLTLNGLQIYWGGTYVTVSLKNWEGIVGTVYMIRVTKLV